MKMQPNLAMHHQAERLQGIVQTQQAIAQAGLDLQVVMDIVTTRVQELTSASAAVVELAEGDEMVYRAASGSAASSVGVRLKIASSLSGACVLSGQILLCPDSEIDDRVDRDACRRVGARSMVVVPLSHEKKVVGVLKVLSPQPQAFGEEDVQTLQLMAGLIGSTLGHAAEFKAKQELLEERTRVMEALLDSEARFKAFMDNSPAVAFMKDEEGHFIYVNRTLEKAFEGTIPQWLGKTSFDMWPHELAEKIRATDLAILKGEEAVEVEETVPLADGPHCWLSHKIPFEDAKGRRFLASMAIDITARKQAEAQLEAVNDVLRSQSVRDALTGLFNRRYMEESLEREIARAQRIEQQVGIIILDIDFFKNINDTYGHMAGDEVLRRLGALLLQHTRKMDIACRFGGEEFVLILPGASAHNTQRKAEDLRAMVMEKAEELRRHAQGLAIEQQGDSISAITISLGTALFPDNGDNGDDVLRAADAALYRAKQAGRNRVEIA